jgi:hypothetical protein
MAKDKNSAQAIERLLDERHKIEQWLERLGGAADQTPDHVKVRVESDYRDRLGEVVRELQSFRDDITTALEQHREARGKLARDEKDSSEKLAEAELRHTVGEFDEARFTKMRQEIDDKLEKIRGELGGIDSEIARLDEVMTLIEAGRPEPEAESAPASVLDEPDELDAAVDAAIAGVAASEAAPAQVDELEQPGDGLDELEFLRSVTEDESQGPAASRASGQMRIPEEVGAGPHTATPDSSGTAIEEEVVIPDQPSGEPKKAAAKTLKCDECGTMNLPTEWYCEKCGAELAAL